MGACLPLHGELHDLFASIHILLCRRMNIAGFPSSSNIQFRIEYLIFGSKSKVCNFGHWTVT